MVKPDKPTYESLARIGFSEKPFADYLDALINEAKETMMYQQDEIQLRISQGRAQAFSELRVRIKEAPDVVRKA